MKKIDLGQTLAILANVGVIAGIVFLAYEIRQNSQFLLANEETLRAEELTRLDELDRQRQLVILESPIVRELYIKSLYSPSEMSREDIWGMSAYLSGRVSILRRSYQAYQEGILTEADWELRRSQAPFFLGTGFARSWWSVTKDDFTMIEGFVEAIDQELATNTVSPDDEWLLMLENAVVESAL